MRSELQRVRHESESHRERIKENIDKIKLNKQLPYLVGNIVEVLDLEAQHEEEDGMALDVDAQRSITCIFPRHLGCCDVQVRKIGSYSNFDSSDNIPSNPRTRSDKGFNSRRTRRDKQRLVSYPRETACRVRFSS